MTKALSNRGYGLCKSAFKELEEEIKLELTVSPRSDGYNNETKKEFSVYIESTKKLYVPKYFGLQRFGIPDEYKIIEGKQITPIFTGSLRNYQIEPINKYLQAANDPLKKGGILQLPPGWGKTVMALNIISQLKKKTLIIVHKDFLLKQWKERIEQYLQNVTVGIIKQNIIEYDKDVVIASLQSLSMRTYDQGTFDQFGLVIIDECHHMAAEVFSRALLKVNFNYALGLSATVTRKDGLSKVFKWFIGDIVYKAKSDNTDTLHVNMKYFYDSNPLYNQIFLSYNGKANITKIITNICEFKPRTKLICDEIISLLHSQPDRNVIVLSERIKQLKDIDQILREGGIVDVGFYIGGMKDADRKETEKKRVILGTYHMVAEGFDLPKLNTLVLASPKSDVEQSVGRIQRQLKNERKYDPLVIDIVDQFCSFTNQGNKRKTFYKKKGFSINEIGKK
jgi:superfamily II DNA or RNA helicase